MLQLPDPPRLSSQWPPTSGDVLAWLVRNAGGRVVFTREMLDDVRGSSVTIFDNGEGTVIESRPGDGRSPPAV